MMENYHSTRIDISEELKDWLESQYEGFTVCFGIPVYRSVKGAITASAVGYRCNRACVLTEPYASIYVFGELVPIKLGGKYVVPS